MSPDPDVPTTPTITVTGIGRAAAAPDVVEVRLGVATTELTVGRARSANATAMTAVLASLRGLGIADADLRTESLTVAPVHDYSGEHPPRLTGYAVANVVAARVRNLDRVADVVDAALAAGANSLEALRFRREDRTAEEGAARAAAVRAARAKADTIAAAAGLEIVEVESIVEAARSDGPQPMALEAARFAAADVATPVEPGSEEIAVSVVATYRVRAR